MKSRHVSVMGREVLDYLLTENGKIYLDCTLGMGGHASRILEVTSSDTHLIGIDIDPQAISQQNQNSHGSPFLAASAFPGILRRNRPYPKGEETL